MTNASTAKTETAAEARRRILEEGGITLTAATHELPLVDGKRVHPATIWRWCRHGLHGVYLEYARLGRRILTSRAALARFADALAEVDEPLESGKPRAAIKRPRTSAARDRAIAQADKILADAGI